MKKLRFAVIGAGNFAELCHIPGLQSHPNAEIVALCGRRMEQTFQVAERFNIPLVYDDYHELLAVNDIDGVTIATPNVSHAEIALAALKAGKHVFCEKPLAKSAEQAKPAYEAAMSGGQVHMVGFLLRYLHGMQKLRDMVAAGAIGMPHYVRIRRENMSAFSPQYRAGWRAVQATSGGYLIQDMGSHYIDLVHWIIGDVGEVCGSLVNIPRIRPGKDNVQIMVETDDLNAVLFRTTGGVHGDYFLSHITPDHGESALEVVGDEGSLMGFLNRGVRDELQWYRMPRGSTEGAWENVQLPSEIQCRKPLALQRMMHAFVDAISNGSADPERDATFRDGYRTQIVLDAIIRSSYMKRWIPVEYS